MSELLPLKTTVGDLCAQALMDSGFLGIGQVATSDITNRAWARLQWMLQVWQRKRYLCYHIVDYGVACTGAKTYSIGPTGNGIVPDISVGPVGLVSRPDKIESAFLRQLNGNPNGQIDFWLTLLQAYEDYARIVLKPLTTLSNVIFYDPGWANSQGLGTLFPWPVPNLGTGYELHVQVKENLPASFPSLATVINLPFEYYRAIVSNLALALRPMFGIGTYPGDMLPLMAKDSLQALRGANTAIAELSIPIELTRGDKYNIYSDQSY
jgi:hypothetical protein